MAYQVSSKEKLEFNANLTLKQAQSGNSNKKGHIRKRGSSILGFVMINPANSTIKYSKRMKSKWLSMVWRTVEKRSIFL
ncbi:transposase [Cuniculiplasma sp. SKW4]|uniref:transposase n=1 Tax=Cuniculiplasma sp. SKW4 TaxID=3400171 RepID=UPI003FD3FD54